MDSFDRLLRDAAPEVPDSGPSRRMTLLLLHGRRDRGRHRLLRWVRSGMAATGVLALFWLTIGSPVDLGSDAFDIHPEIDPDSGSLFFQKTVGRLSTTVNSEEQAKQIVEFVESRQFTLQRLLGTEVGGQTIWTPIARGEIDGEMRNMAVPDGTFDLPQPEDQSLHDDLFADPLLREISSELKRRPPDYTQLSTVGRYEVELRTWVFETARFGTVRLHRAFPRKQYHPVD